MRGRLITVEGSEGSGKSTQLEMIFERLSSRGVDVVILREPGGVELSEKIRNLLLDVKNVNMTGECETLLYMAARAQLVSEKLLPTLQKGTHVLCDRFLDSTLAYQGYGNGIDIDFIQKIGVFITQSVKPDLTLLFDIDAKVGLSRITRSKDRIERRAMAYHQRVRQGYLRLARAEPRRIRIIDAGNRTKEDIFRQVMGYVEELFGETNA
jgi:dTMP kinase